MPSPNETTSIPTLESLEAIAYLDDRGQIPEDPLTKKVGVYAIFDTDRNLQYIGYSRDIYASLKQHLVRRPQQCHWLKFKTIDRPSRTILEEIKSAWIAENGTTPPGNDSEEKLWTDAIDIKPLLSPAERERYEAAFGDELAQSKLLKQKCRDIEAEILADLERRGVKMSLRFNPKLKDKGLLDLK